MILNGVIYLNTSVRACEMAQWVRALAVNPNNQNSVPGTHVVEAEPAPEGSALTFTVLLSKQRKKYILNSQYATA